MNRTLVALAVALPILIAVAADYAAGFRIWLVVVAVTLVPLVVVNRAYPRVGGVDAYDPSHPSHRRATWVELATAVLAGALVVLAYALLT